MAASTADQSLAYTVIQVLSRPSLRRSGIRCVKSIFYHFFYLQYWAAFFKGRIPVSPVDHPLDKAIPFKPRWVAIYLDFVAFWVRVIGFLLSRFKRRALKPVGDFIDSMERLYGFAAEVYIKNLSTTDRPRYYGRPRFVLIHAVDPHLMCIPSLHVMVVIRTYTAFRKILRDLGEAEGMAAEIAGIHRGALAITEAILYVKQHSVNCVSAAMYAMTCFNRPLFPPEEAEDFVSRLFTAPGSPGEAAAIRSHIITLYRRFLEEGRSTPHWRDPLLRFLRERRNAPARPQTQTRQRLPKGDPAGGDPR
jgi:hypothetical protein